MRLFKKIRGEGIFSRFIKGDDDWHTKDALVSSKTLSWAELVEGANAKHHNEGKILPLEGASLGEIEEREKAPDSVVKFLNNNTFKFYSFKIVTPYMETPLEFGYVDQQMVQTFADEIQNGIDKANDEAKKGTGVA